MLHDLFDRQQEAGREDIEDIVHEEDQMKDAREEFI